MPDLSRLPGYLLYLPLIVGLVALLWAQRLTSQGRAREREVIRLSEEADTLKNDFVAMVSHELRTPLTTIAGFADILVRSWEDLPQEEVNEFLSIINRQSIYLGDLVEDVLVIPRLEVNRLPLEPELFDLGDLIEDVALMVFPSGEKKTSLVSLPDGVRVFADRRRVQQVMRNLMENARKYGGDQIMIEGFVMGDQYLVIISDNGPGVPDEETRRVFENFEQLSKGDTREALGIGLGLPIARRLARAMGGDVWYERRFPTGARFCYSLPLRRRVFVSGGDRPGVPESEIETVVEVPEAIHTA
ncbi:MAG: HAMP domain-containing histidine kinase [Acidobacteria bacterium]|nr:HAMP domain-containing histidine kinase [Acidobacteriota bacterium]TDI38777.1 MAG: HAMP domain-containing histidine kinase [Acidobacteriota bacterium]TDI52415.1 MAG: HAMP domain-containing histidine kinase [Acidobacteriota bacterium]TDI55792.1 MAG: HAMP domain-containing histidine kinase [Acidobacteriota bacterium]